MAPQDFHGVPFDAHSMESDKLISDANKFHKGSVEKEVTCCI